WVRRVAGAAIDAVPTWVATIVLYAGYLPMYRGLFHGDFDVQPRYGLVLVGTLLYLGAFGLSIYNHYFLAGRTGQSYGKRVMKIWLVGRSTGRPIGPFDAFLRGLLHILDAYGYVGYLWPLWDDERQTLADKLAQTVVVRTPVPPLTELERRRP
ncbi:MAG: RDD family protein, partial [Janthinobacterium lividum]